jgi:RES domain-containing protein
MGAFAATYLSCEYQTSVEEYFAGNRRRGLPPEEAMPMVVTGVAVRFSNILDFTDGQVRRALHVSSERMVGERWWEVRDQGEEAITQAIGRLSREAGIKGLLVPSAAYPGGVNLVVFPNRLAPGVDRLEIVNPDRLPRRSFR